MWSSIFKVFVLGYLVLSRSFAYFGIPTLNIFLGEAVLLVVLICRPLQIFGRWISVLLSTRPILSGLDLWYFAFLFYGLFSVARGIYLGYPLLDVLKNFPFNYYPLYLFIGFWVGSRNPNWLSSFIPLLAWCNGLYGLLYIFLLQNSLYTIPWAPEVRLFGQPAASALVVISLLTFSGRISRVWHLIVLNILVMLAIQVRAEWLSLLVGLAIWIFLGRRFGRAAAIVIGTILVLIAIDLLPFEVIGRTSPLSTAHIVARLIAPFSPEGAAQLIPGGGWHAGSVAWRVQWWGEIWDAVHRQETTALFGFGYGYILSDLSGLILEDIRSPHNIFFYVLAYSGWIGVIIFIAFELSIFLVLFKQYCVTGEYWGIIVWAMYLSKSFFGNVLETPFGAIPFYFLIGIGISLSGIQRKRIAHRSLGTEN